MPPTREYRVRRCAAESWGRAAPASASIAKYSSMVFDPEALRISSATGEGSLSITKFRIYVSNARNIWYRVGRNDKNSIRKIQIVPKMLAQIGIPLGVVHRSGRSHNPEKTRRDLFRSRRRCGFAAGTRQQHRKRQQTEKISQHNAQLQSYGNPRQCQIYEAISGNTLIIDGKRKGPITNTRFDLPG